MLDLTRRFSFGIDLDDPWRYSGIEAPRSIIIPHLLSVSLPQAKILDLADDMEIKKYGEEEPGSEAGRACRALAENLVAAKIDFARCWFPWKFFEPTPVPEDELGQLLEASYSKWPMDDFVKVLTSHGIDLVPVLACGYQRMLPQGLEPDPDKALYLRRVSIHARLLVRKYKDRIRSWQIENEPNWWAKHSLGGWRSGISWIRERGFRQDLLKTLNDAVHTEDPSAQTIINLEADAKKIDPASYSPYCDILGLDFYPNYKAAIPVKTGFVKLADEVAKTLNKPVIISETGYPSGPTLLGYSLANQSKFVGNACRDAHGLDGINGIGVWRYVDTAWRSFPPQENHFGLFDKKGNPKPSWTTLSRVIKELK